MNTLEIADFIAGFMEGFTGNNKKTEIEQCFHDNDPFEQDICDIVADIRTKDNQKIAEAMQKLLKTDIPEFKTFMSACPADVQTDFQAVGNWYKFWKAQGEMKVYSTAYKNVVGNMAAIKADVQTLEGYFDNQDWYNAAKEASVIAKTALPVSSFENVGTSCGDFTIDQKSMADYLAGFIHGFTGEDDRADLEAHLADD